MELSTREKKNGMVCRRCVNKLHRQGMPQKSTAGGRKKVTVTTAVAENTTVKRDKEPAAKFNAFTPAVNRNKNTVAKPAVQKTAVNRNKNYNTGKPVETPAVVDLYKKYQTVKPVETPAVVNQHKKIRLPNLLDSLLQSSAAADEKSALTCCMMPVMQTGKSAILITGDASRNKAMCLPGGGNVTIKINLPAKWDELMSARGYAPLNTFFLKSNLRPEKNPRKFDFYRTFRK
jgi:hypothetical protein